MNIQNNKFKNKKLGYALYDFANSGYVLLFQSFLFPLLLSSFVTDTAVAERNWGLVLLTSNLIAVLLAPVIGRVADLKNRIKIFSITILIAALLSFFSVLAFEYTFLLVAFIIFNVSFELSQSLYDSFLSVISSDKKERIGISTFAWGFGYLGGVLFVIVYFILNKLQVDNNIILAVASILYLFFSYLAIRNIRKNTDLQKETSVLETGFKRLLAIKLPKEFIPILLIYFIVFLGTTAIVNFSSLFFNKELLITETRVGAVMLGAQVLAFPLTILFGKIAQMKGIVKTLRLCIVIWCIGILAMYFSKTLVHIIFVAFIFSFIIGSTQSLIRAHYSNLVKGNISEMFGFYGMSNKLGAVLSPLLITLSVSTTGSIRNSFFIIFILMLVALILSKFLKEEIH